MNLLRTYWRTQLHTKILLGLLAGIPVGLLLGPNAAAIKPLGDLFLRLIWMIVVPLVFASIFIGTASLGDLRKLGRIGAKTISYYIITTAVAITIGLTIAAIVKPGARLDAGTQTRLLESYRNEAMQDIKIAENAPGITETLLRIVPSNPVKSMAEGDMLPIIFFAIIFGIAVTMLPAGRARPAIDFFEAVNEAMMQLVHLVMKFAPIGVLALIASVVGRFGAGILLSLISYSLVILAGLVIHMGFVYSAAVWISARMSPLTFFRGMRPAQIIAFTTSSSNATLPVNMETVERNLGVPKSICSFVLPLGATINMDGTALYQGVAAAFIAQVYGIPLTIGDQVTIVLMATLASIGTAGVPGVGIIMLTMVLKSVGLPLEGIALILGVDRILDMCRTVVNITGDASAAVMVAATEGELRMPAGKGAAQ